MNTAATKSEIIARLAAQLVANNDLYKDAEDDARIYWENRCETRTDAMLAASNHGLLSDAEERELSALLGWHKHDCPYGLEFQRHTSCGCFA